MCNPVLAGALATTGGVAMQNNQANAAQKYRNQARQANSERQRMLEQEARGGINEVIAALARPNVNAGVRNTANKMTSNYNQATTPRPAANASAGAPAIIADIAAAVAGQRQAAQMVRNEKLANLNSFTDYLNTTIKPQMADSASNTQMLGSFMQGNNVPLQAELEAANTRGNSPLAQLLIGGGQVATGYGLKK
jgi:hypothetical protein